MEELLQRLGSEVRAARKRQGLTQEALAERIGVVPETVSHIERGNRRPSLEAVFAIAKALPVDFSRVFDSVTDGRVTSPKRANAEAELMQTIPELTDKEVQALVEFSASLIAMR